VRAPVTGQSHEPNLQFSADVLTFVRPHPPFSAAILHKRNPAHRSHKIPEIFYGLPQPAAEPFDLKARPYPTSISSVLDQGTHVRLPNAFGLERILPVKRCEY
jgi:hypothetical protein